MYTYPLSSINQLPPRSYIFSSNVATLTLQSTSPESKISFYTSKSLEIAGGTPNFALSASNERFGVLKNDTLIATFNLLNGSTPDVVIGGAVRASNVYISAPAPRKALVLSDYNDASQHAFAGVGFNGSVLNYQVPVRNAVHAFFGATSPTSSKEWMRIQESISATPQVGIGTNVFSGAEALRVSGDTIIDGKLISTGGIIGSFDSSSLPSNVVRTEVTNGRVSSNVLPQQLVYVNPQTNVINTSVLPMSYRFQFMNANSSVGIGTRAPKQKLHVEGGACVSDRLGLGTTAPTCRLHVLETGASIPTIRVDANAGGDIFQSFSAGNPMVIMQGTHPSIGIGVTSVNSSNSLEVNGNVYVGGKLTCQDFNFGDTLNVSSINIQNGIQPFMRMETLQQDANNSQTVTGNAFVTYIPHLFNGGVTTDILQPTQSAGLIKVLDASLDVDRDVFIRGAAVSASDMRLKSEIKVIDRPLDRLEYLHGYTYKRTDLGTDERFAGVIAQEVVDALPEAVTRLPSNDFIGVRYTSLIPLLIESIHALKKQITDLESQLNSRIPA